MVLMNRAGCLLEALPREAGSEAVSCDEDAHEWSQSGV